ncbi:MAG: restriction endonuclease subunit S [Prevotella sp.]|nr:restriction endonuclease subunit S [Prevotella sp.]
MVEWKKIEDMGSFFGGLTGKRKEDFVDGNARFITYMNVFSNPSLDTTATGSVRIGEKEKQNKIQKGDILFTGSSETPDEAGMSCVVTKDLDDDYYMNSFCFGIRITTPSLYNLDYLKHLLRSAKTRKNISKSSSGVTRFNVSKARFGKILIPIPSLQEQERIVNILDTFTASIDNLKAQIEQRRKQYEHYRDSLLDLEGKPGVEMKTLGEVCIIKTGRGITQKDCSDGAPYPVMSGGQTPMGNYKEYNREGNTVTISRVGAYAGFVSFMTERFYCNDKCFSVIPNKVIDIEPKFLYSLLKNNEKSIKELQSEGGVPTINTKKIGGISIPLPPLSEQERIVSILDKFEASIANLEAQLEQRQKQYEYYRERLLTFEKSE